MVTNTHPVVTVVVAADQVVRIRKADELRSELDRLASQVPSSSFGHLQLARADPAPRAHRHLPGAACGGGGRGGDALCLLNRLFELVEQPSQLVDDVRP